MKNVCRGQIYFFIPPVWVRKASCQIKAVVSENDLKGIFQREDLHSQIKDCEMSKY